MEFNIIHLALSPFVIGLVQVVKKAIPDMPKGFVPLLSIIVAVGVVFGVEETLSLQGLLQGVALGLLSSGLWSSGKAMFS